LKSTIDSLESPFDELGWESRLSLSTNGTQRLEKSFDQFWANENTYLEEDTKTESELLLTDLGEAQRPLLPSGLYCPKTANKHRIFGRFGALMDKSAVAGSRLRRPPMLTQQRSLR
jgi:hypothetical protein